MTDDQPYDFIDPDEDESLEDELGWFRRVFERVFR